MRCASALKVMGLPTTPYPLHSLHECGANFAYNHDNADINYVRAHGTCKSDAVGTYIKPQDAASNTVLRALAAL